MTSLASLCAMLLAASPAGETSFRMFLDECGTPPDACLDDTGCYITAYYDHSGKDWNCQVGMTYPGHVGTDVGVDNTWGVRPVVAAAAGQVIELNDGCPNGYWGSTCGGGFGNYVKLKHADNKITIYGHLFVGTLEVAAHQQVDCGQLLGRAGSSGNSTGPHTHFEVIHPVYGSDDPYSGACGGPLTYWVSQGPYCHLPGSTCEEGCAPQCSGKQCGPDGCGGTCGSCQAGQTCQANGTCAASGIDDAILVTETIPAGTAFSPGTSFTKSWTLRNTGTSTWSRPGTFVLAWQRGVQLGPPQDWLYPDETIAPGAEKVWQVPMEAPTTAGTYEGFWRMQHEGVVFGPELRVSIVVDSSLPAADGAKLVSKSIADDSNFAAGVAFDMSWTLKNTGGQAWTADDLYSFEFVSGDLLGAQRTWNLGATESVAPGQQKTWTVPMQAPAQPGTYRGYWRMWHSLDYFGEMVWVEIRVLPVVPHDADGDGHASIASGGDDCDDGDRTVYPGHPEDCDGKDNDCSGLPEQNLVRECADPCPGIQACVGGQWEDCNGRAPTKEECNGLDDNCDPLMLIDEGAACPSGLVCALGACVPPIVPEPDAGPPPGPDAGRPDAAAPGPDAGGELFAGGGCGCASAATSAGAAGLSVLGVSGALLAAARRRRR